MASSAPGALAARVPSSGRFSTPRLSPPGARPAARLRDVEAEEGEAAAQTRTLAAQGGLGARTLVARLKCSTRQLLKPLATGRLAIPWTRLDTAASWPRSGLRGRIVGSAEPRAGLQGQSLREQVQRLEKS